MLTGACTAIVTPFRDGKVDYPAFQRLIRRQIAAGIAAIVPVGTTGESPTVTYEEHIEIIGHAVEYAGGKIHVMAGTGGNSTAEAVHLTERAAKAGAHSTLQVAPYYNKPAQEGLFQHFLEVSRATRLPIVLYSIPSRCGIEISIETTRRLAAASPRFIAMKEAGGNVERVTQLRAALGPRFSILCGDDALTLPFMAAGAHGVISVASNLIPREVVKLVAACAKGDFATGLKLHDRFYPLFKDLFIETNPGPIKAALALRGEIAEEYRLPIVRLSERNRDALAATLSRFGLLSNP